MLQLYDSNISIYIAGSAWEPQGHLDDGALVKLLAS